MLSNTYNTIQYQSFVCTQSSGFKYCLLNTNNSIKHQLNDQTILFLTIQFSISYSFAPSSIWPIDRTLLGATTPGQSRPWSDSNEEILCFLQSSSRKDYVSCASTRPKTTLQFWSYDWANIFQQTVQKKLGKYLSKCFK